MSTPTDVILRELKSIDIGAIDPHNMARTLSRVLDLTIPALSEIAAHPPTSEPEYVSDCCGADMDQEIDRDIGPIGSICNACRQWRTPAHPKEVAPTVDQVALRGDRPPTISRNRHPRAIH
jgi:hypothetical protein